MSEPNRTLGEPMIRVHLKPEFGMLRDFAAANDWIIDADSGCLTVASDHKAVASFDRGAWIYVESITDDQAADAA